MLDHNFRPLDVADHREQINRNLQNILQQRNLYAGQPTGSCQVLHVPDLGYRSSPRHEHAACSSNEETLLLPRVQGDTADALYECNQTAISWDPADTDVSTTSCTAMFRDQDTCPTSSGARTQHGLSNLEGVKDVRLSGGRTREKGEPSFQDSTTSLFFSGDGCFRCRQVDHIHAVLKSAETGYLNQIAQLQSTVSQVDAERVQAVNRSEQLLRSLEQMQKKNLEQEREVQSFRYEALQKDDLLDRLRYEYESLKVTYSQDRELLYANINFFFTSQEQSSRGELQAMEAQGRLLLQLLATKNELKMLEQVHVLTTNCQQVAETSPTLLAPSLALKHGEAWHRFLAPPAARISEFCQSISSRSSQHQNRDTSQASSSPFTSGVGDKAGLLAQLQASNEDLRRQVELLKTQRKTPKGDCTEEDLRLVTEELKEERALTSEMQIEIDDLIATELTFHERVARMSTELEASERALYHCHLLQKAQQAEIRRLTGQIDRAILVTPSLPTASGVEQSRDTWLSSSAIQVSTPCFNMATFLSEVRSIVDCVFENRVQDLKECMSTIQEVYPQRMRVIDERLSALHDACISGQSAIGMQVDGVTALISPFADKLSEAPTSGMTEIQKALLVQQEALHRLHLSQCDELTAIKTAIKRMAHFSSHNDTVIGAKLDNLLQGQNMCLSPLSPSAQELTSSRTPAALSSLSDTHRAVAVATAPSAGETRCSSSKLSRSASLLAMTPEVVTSSDRSCSKDSSNKANRSTCKQVHFNVGATQTKQTPQEVASVTQPTEGTTRDRCSSVTSVISDEHLFNPQALSAVSLPPHLWDLDDSDDESIPDVRGGQYRTPYDE